MPGGVLSAALACRCGSERRVLKLSGRHVTSARAEAAALAAWDGAGACRLYFAAEDGHVMLLEAIEPGTRVQPGDDGQDAMRVAALLGVLHAATPTPEAIPDAGQELEWRFGRAAAHLDGPSYARGLISADDVAHAREAALELHDSRGVSVLLHGDFIDKNILLDRVGNWRAIDPRPCVGDPCLDAAFWALAHRPGTGVASRCRLLAHHLGLDGGRVWAWARAFAVSEAVLVTDPERARAHAGLAAGGL